MGMLERGGKVRAGVIADRKKHQHAARPRRQCRSWVRTSSPTSIPAIPFIAENDYVHEIINHIEGYVRDHVHTNGIENFWSCLKRGLNGTYISVEPVHLDRYVDEQVFRFNLRHKHTDAERFKAVLKDIVGRRLTYAELTGREVQPRKPNPYRRGGGREGFGFASGFTTRCNRFLNASYSFGSSADLDSMFAVYS